MPSTPKDRPKAIEIIVCLRVQGPIIPGDYPVSNTTINVSYPESIDLGLPTPILIPKGVSTLFVVRWQDENGQTESQLLSKSHDRQRPVYRALELINKLLIAFKLVRVGHADGLGIRTVGVADTLFHASRIDGVPVGNLNMGLRLDARDYPWRVVGEHPFDSSGTTKLATPHIDVDTFPIARKYVRCFELFDHGYYNEATIVAHANLDDLVQKVIHDQLQSKGLEDEQVRAVLLRAIKEARLSIYLGPLLQALAGTTIDQIWPKASKAIAWFNAARNRIAHQGWQADRDTAGKAIFVCIKILAGLNKHGLISAEFPAGMFRQARVIAAWTSNPPDWVPLGKEEVENDEFEKEVVQTSDVQVGEVG